MFCSTMWIFILLFYPLTPVVWCFQQISIFLPLCNTAVWRWRNAVVGSALLSVCSSTVLPVAQLSGGKRGESINLASYMQKPGPHLAHILILVFLWFSVRCFFVFSEYFPVMQDFTIVMHIGIHHHFSSFWVLPSWPPTVASGDLSVKFCPRLKPLVTPLPLRTTLQCVPSQDFYMFVVF